MVKQVEVKITQNIYGNYRGRVTGMKYAEHLGCNKFDATEWASDRLEFHKGSTLHKDSVITMQDIEKFWK